MKINESDNRHIARHHGHERVNNTQTASGAQPATEAKANERESVPQSTNTGAHVSREAVKANVEERKARLQSAIAARTDSEKPVAEANKAGATQGPEALKQAQRESYRKLIAADIKAAYGREANDEDYKYWLEKLEGPNDSGFVTSGQMTATEYWHRRLLGWQAGGNDVARYGPYAGGGGPRGELQAATSVVPGVPPGGVYNQASPERIAQIKNIVSTDIRTAYGREATEQDYGYWLEKFLGANDSGFVTGGQMSADEYWHRRLLGWQAGGQDVAKFGPYAGGSEANGPVPPVTSITQGAAGG